LKIVLPNKLDLNDHDVVYLIAFCIAHGLVLYCSSLSDTTNVLKKSRDVFK